MMILPALTIAMSASAFAAPVYEVIQVERAAVFAGRLGHRVSETLVLRADGRTVHVRVSGDYHTMALHRKEWFRAGDRVTFQGGLDRRTIARDHVRILKD